MANLLRKGNRAEPLSSPPQAPKQKHVAPPPVTSTKQTQVDGAINPWDEAQIWIESVQKEKTTLKQWEQMYGFMADFDQKGNLKIRKHTLENTTRFSETIPNSRGHDYGWRLQSEIGQEIKNLQIKFNEQYRKRVPTEALGYD